MLWGCRVEIKYLAIHHAHQCVNTRPILPLITQTNYKNYYLRENSTYKRTQSISETTNNNPQREPNKNEKKGASAHLSVVILQSIPCS